MSLDLHLQYGIEIPAKPVPSHFSSFNSVCHTSNPLYDRPMEDTTQSRGCKLAFLLSFLMCRAVFFPNSLFQLYNFHISWNFQLFTLALYSVVGSCTRCFTILSCFAERTRPFNSDIHQ